MFVFSVFNVTFPKYSASSSINGFKSYFFYEQNVSEATLFMSEPNVLENMAGEACWRKPYKCVKFIGYVNGSSMEELSTLNF